MNYSVTKGNAKTGAMPTIYSPENTCPDSCVMKHDGSCYAKAHRFSAPYWAKLSRGEIGISWDQMLATIRTFAPDTLARFNVAGDLPGNNNDIDRTKLKQLVRASRGRRLFTYTHKPVIGGNYAENVQAIFEANMKHKKSGTMLINLSADSLDQGVDLHALDIGPVAVVVPSDTSDKSFKHRGVRVVVCPAQTKRGKENKVTCASCNLCARDRKAMVAFKAHGNGRKKIDQLISLRLSK